MSSNRERALRAAVELLGTQGLRALTHARVDALAELPRGSTSNYFRTRAALLNGVLEHMLATELPEVEAALAADTPEELVETMVGVFDFLTGPSWTMTAARLALFTEAAHDEGLRAKLAAGRRVMEARVVPALARLGAPDPKAGTELIAACMEGLLLHRLGRHAELDARGVIERAVRAALA